MLQIHVLLMHINQCLICTLARGLGKNIVKTALSRVDIRPFFGTQPCVAEIGIDYRYIPRPFATVLKNFPGQFHFKMC